MGLVTLTFDLLTLKLVCGRIKGWNLHSEFWHARPSGSRVIRYVRDGRTDGRTKAMLIAPFPKGVGIIIDLYSAELRSISFDVTLINSFFLTSLYCAVYVLNGNDEIDECVRTDCILCISRNTHTHTHTLLNSRIKRA